MTPMRKATFLGLVSLLALLVLATTAVAGPIKDKKARLAAVQAQLSQVYEQSDMAVERYNEAASRLGDVQDRITRNQHLLKVAEYKLGVANDHLTSRARQVYKADDAGILDVVFASRTFEDLLTQIDMMQRMTESDARTARAARAYRQEISDRRVALEEDRKSAVRLVAQREESKDQVLALQAQLESTAGGLKDEIAELQAKAAAAAKKAAEQGRRAGGLAGVVLGRERLLRRLVLVGLRRRHGRRPRRLRALGRRRHRAALSGRALRVGRRQPERLRLQRPHHVLLRADRHRHVARRDRPAAPEQARLAERPPAGGPRVLRQRQLQPPRGHLRRAAAA